jgi:hypothetical protein
MVRSVAQRRVSNHATPSASFETALRASSFETALRASSG